MRNEVVELRDLLRETLCALADNGVENAGFEARQILEKAGISPMKILAEPCEKISPEVCEKVHEMTEKRVSGYPLQYILGEWEFYGLPFEVGEGVLIPRQDTETLVEITAEFLKTLPENERKTLDLCAGSGCIGITLAKLFAADVTLVEKSREAFAYLERNIALNGVKAQCDAVLGDCFDEEKVRGEYNLILSNPPYLTEKDMENLQKEVSFEPETALYGGADGLDFYRALLAKYPKMLKENGLFAVEIGLGEEDEVARLFRENGLEAQFAEDYRGIIRVVYGVKY